MTEDYAQDVHKEDSIQANVQPQSKLAQPTPQSKSIEQNKLQEVALEILNYGIARVAIRKPPSTGAIFPIWGKGVMDHATAELTALVENAEKVAYDKGYATGRNSMNSALAEAKKQGYNSGKSHMQFEIDNQTGNY